ncbi:hypothetical protein A2154_01985 [Candidatus Gottesmanbacteria bacterium RBG_16_43_7]|uniref:Pseudouridine synthase RsuA/RluA-like domain-containing protein n=1 Tax=Candidatus Gottesmanbacteria bacterium RBG_16_43_7 TaxID=1798373 RepID=A0A1F5Z867_9BACT|nr:MAG: hypothetical protein A2154_01985 [Candidatus Gottesmanbacteria bacterium RBG_16_43_7]
MHRLDKDTSGCLLIAKSPPVMFELQSLFKLKKTQKTYIALVHGYLKPSEGSIDAPIDRLPWNRLRFGIMPQGKPAVTLYRVISYWNRIQGKLSQPFSLVNVFPQTGRTHQIRVHFQYLHHPLAADKIYAGRIISRDDQTWIPRIMLHAQKLAFTHPRSGRLIEIESPLPQDFKSVLGQMQEVILN